MDIRATNKVNRTRSVATFFDDVESVRVFKHAVHTATYHGATYHGSQHLQFAVLIISQGSLPRVSGRTLSLNLATRFRL